MDQQEHYEQAERCLSQAGQATPRPEAIPWALRAIGHALLAGLGDELVILEGQGDPDPDTPESAAEKAKQAREVAERAPRWMRGEK